jgi:hypothetical protein
MEEDRIVVEVEKGIRPDEIWLRSGIMDLRIQWRSAEDDSKKSNQSAQRENSGKCWLINRLLANDP